jgi:hypothetical protein
VTAFADGDYATNMGLEDVTDGRTRAGCYAADSVSHGSGHTGGVRVVFLVAGLAALAVGVVYVGVDTTEDERAPAAPSYGQLARLVERVVGDEEALARHGIYLEGAGVGDSCTVVHLLNPTAPNIGYVEQRYPGACVEPRPLGPSDDCAPAERHAPRAGPVTVPDVDDLGLVEASRRVLAASLTFTTTCLGRARDVEWVPLGPADGLVRVASQCPRAGERVARGTEVALQARGVLPGGFEHFVGVLGRCDDERNPES